MAKSLEYYLKGDTYYHYFDRNANAEARRLYRLAVDEERAGERPDFARPFSDLAYSILHAWLFNWDVEASLEEAHRLAVQAVEIAADDYYPRWMLAAVLLYLRRYEESDTAYREAMSLAADQAILEEQRALRVDWADYLLLTGEPEAALREVEEAIRQSPVPERWFHWVHAWALYETCQFQASIGALRRLRSPRNAIRKNLIANFVALGDQAREQSAADAENYFELARFHARRFLAEELGQGVAYAPRGQLVWPGLSQVEDRLPFRDPARRNRWKGHLERAFEGLVQPAREDLSGSPASAL